MAMNLKDTMNSGNYVLGLIVRSMKSTDVVRVARASGHDFLCIDSQHGIFNLETIEAIVQVANGYGIGSLVRVRNYLDLNVTGLLDCGVEGIIVPNIESADQAIGVVEQCRFPPYGNRSVVGGGSLADPEGKSLKESILSLNERTFVVCMIESQIGLANIEEIATVEGVDVLHVGCNDLLTDMGIPGEFDSAALATAMSLVIDTCNRHGKHAGLGGDRDTARQIEYLRSGVRFLTTQSDFNYLVGAARSKVRDLRSGTHTTDV